METVRCIHLAVLFDPERDVCPQVVGDRLLVLQRLVAELELNQKRLNKKNSHLENQKQKLKRDRDALRDTLREVSPAVRPIISINSTLIWGFKWHTRAIDIL